jgi:hypothetical protein
VASLTNTLIARLTPAGIMAALDIWNCCAAITTSSDRIAHCSLAPKQDPGYAGRTREQAPDVSGRLHVHRSFFALRLEHLLSPATNAIEGNRTSSDFGGRLTTLDEGRTASVAGPSMKCISP